MSTMQSTVRRIEEDETRRAVDSLPAGDGWKPAGPPLIDDSQWKPGEASAEVASRAPVVTVGDTRSAAIPHIGKIVVYHLRDGDSRNMRTKFPAMVMDRDPATGLLMLHVTYDSGDDVMMQRVPAHAAPEPGWELVSEGPDELSLNVARLGDRVAALEAELMEWDSGSDRLSLSGKPLPPRDEEIGQLEKSLADIRSRLRVLEAKRGPGRSPNPDKPKG